ncbi:TetR/AcrR family transcriptional regulator (plasmid) [Rhodococcus opacus]|uniref:TetR/AcrR family transcriptional regulator n=1 Tax=Rhodococcus opacus TaxID=37919 RepID=UPI0002A36DA0|nr:TetR/AcrR family transcriptional regulator [Rhodococcus opacus]ELB88315.1 TetR family transcriptional regulator [Rhodococcus wratislaviensis IFP 2016]MDV6248075.1 TetR/AcrR family transcriptional regulator [Rhodococcus opacus]WKN59885.1 TetR/AcrR family transcriptional regulator [Rhodococcus opacus]
MLQRAAEEFDRNGYLHTTTNNITDASYTTRGGLYFHFKSKNELARAVIDEGLTRFDQACTQCIESHPRALEALIEISYLMANYGRDDPMIRAAFRLVFEIGDYHGTERVAIFEEWAMLGRDLAHRALTEGDLREGGDPEDIGLLMMEVAHGTRRLAEATDDVVNLPCRMTSAWRLLLPALTDPSKERYFRQFAARR